MKIRIKFSKEGEMKFIGHLDMVRYFQKVFRRCGIDIAYSQGFSPHQQISFAAPLGLGLTSRGEYMDIMVHSTKDSKTMLEMINKEMVSGVKALSYVHIEDETRHSNAMAIVAAADYEISFRYEDFWTEELRSAFSDFLSRSSIPVTKKTKKSEATVDIRPMIYAADVREDGIYMKVATGSAANLKPELVFETFMEAMGLSFDPYELLVCRLEMYAKTDEGLVPLEALGKTL